MNPPKRKPAKKIDSHPRAHGAHFLRKAADAALVMWNYFRTGRKAKSIPAAKGSIKLL